MRCVPAGTACCRAAGPGITASTVVGVSAIGVKQMLTVLAVATRVAPVTVSWRGRIIGIAFALVAIPAHAGR